MSNKKVGYLRLLKDAPSDRLRAEREQLGLSQAELAQATGVSRSTQISYERGETEPSTAYLRAAEAQGVNIGKLLFGIGSVANAEQTPSEPNWSLIQHCAETVEFFCIRFAPTCPARYRWEMISQLYRVLITKEQHSEPDASQPTPLQLLDKIWAGYGN